MIAANLAYFFRSGAGVTQRVFAAYRLRCRYNIPYNLEKLDDHEYATAI